MNKVILLVGGVQVRLINDFVYRKSILKECEKLKNELEEAIENEDHEVVLAIRNQLSAF